MFGVSRKKTGCAITLFVVGTVLIVLAGIFNILVNSIIDFEMKKNLQLKKGTIAYKFWQKPPVPISFGIYVFDITNPDEILAGTAVPAVSEKGPYVYKMHIEKTNIVYHKNNTVEYVQPQLFVFDREASVGPETDTFTTINFPYITVASILQNEYAWLQKIVDLIFLANNESTFMTRSVHDIWWGYEEPVLEEIAAVLRHFNISIELLNGKFGFYMDRNNTGDGLYNVFDGLNENLNNYVEIDHWNGLKQLSSWTTPYANRIEGTDGSMHPPYVTKKSNLSIFDAYLHRTLKLVNNGTSSYRGIRTLRFLVPYSEFANATENPDNVGFCTPDANHCIPSGAYNFSNIAYFAPVYVSLPHFVGGDPYYQRQISGLKPSQIKHQPFYDIQPLTGVSMRAARRYQIVVRTQSFEHFSKLTSLPVSYLPILWIDGMAEIDPSTANLLKTLIQDTLDAVPYIRLGFFVLSGLIILGSVALFLYWRRKSKQERMDEDDETKPLLNGKSRNGASRNGINAGTGDVESITPSASTEAIPSYTY